MGRIRLTGATSGYTELRAANAAGNNTIILPTTNGGEVIVSDSSGNVNIDSGTFYVDASNNRVGVGTSSPSSLLHLAATVPELKLSATGGATARLLADGSALYAGTTGAHDIRLETDGTTRLFIAKTSGNVGIGTSNAQALLDLTAASGADHLAIRNWPMLKPVGTGVQYGGYNSSQWTELSYWTSGSRALTIDSSQRVGIGTTSPGFPLQIGATGSPGVAIDSANSGIHGTFGSGGGLVLRAQLAATAGGGQIFLGGSTRGDGDLNAIVFSNANSERARIDSSGRLLVGTSSARGNFFNSTVSPLIQQEGISGSGRFMSVTYGTASEDDPIFILGKHRGASIGGNTVVANGDGLGKISFQGSDGSELVEGAAIRAEVDGTPGANDMPGRLVFSTTADGASSPTERMRISSNGDTTITCTTYSSVNSATTDSNTEVLRLSTGASNSSNNKIIQIVASGGQGRGIVYSGNSASQAPYFAAASDRRLKTNIREYTEGYEKIKAIPVKLYDEIDGKKNIAGWIADEVQQVIPSAINGAPNAVDSEGNPIYQSLGATNFIPDMVQALQAAIAKIEALEAEVAALKAQ